MQTKHDGMTAVLTLDQVRINDIDQVVGQLHLKGILPAKQWGVIVVDPTMAREQLGLSRQRLHQLATSGKIRRYKVGDVYYYDAGDVIKRVKECHRKPVPANA